MYLPFLFIGSAFYMYEKKTINLYALISFIILVFYLCFNLTEQYHIESLSSNFIVIGFLVFIGLWLMRNKSHIISSFIDALIIKISLLTYSVYLFHNFLWSHIATILHTYNFNSKYWILLVLFLWCYLMHMLIETPMNKLGKRISKYVLQKRVSS